MIITACTTVKSGLITVFYFLQSTGQCCRNVSFLIFLDFRIKQTCRYFLGNKIYTFICLEQEGLCIFDPSSSAGEEAGAA